MPQFGRGSGTFGSAQLPAQPERTQDREDLARLVKRLESFSADPDPSKRTTSAVLLAKLRPQVEVLRSTG